MYPLRESCLSLCSQCLGSDTKYVLNIYLQGKKEEGEGREDSRMLTPEPKYVFIKLVSSLTIFVLPSFG